MRFVSGACHGDELGYLFRVNLSADKIPQPDEETLIVRSQMVRLWANFAKSGYGHFL